MLRNQELIEKLTEEQKLRIVTGFASLSDERLNALGMPRVVATELDDINEKYGYPYPKHTGLANSWDCELFNSVANDLSYRAGGDANVIYAPPAYLRSSAYALGVSEDPFLVRELMRGMLNGISESGAVACLTDFSARTIDAAYLDKTPDPRALNELLFKAYRDLIADGKSCGAVSETLKPTTKRWAEVNTDIVNKMLAARSENVKLVHMAATQDVTVASLPKNTELVSDTSVGALKAALLNYRRVKADVDRGAVSLEELNKAIADGVAVSDEMIDIAVDKVVDFARECAGKRRLEYVHIGEDVTEDEARSAYNTRLSRSKKAFEEAQQHKIGDDLSIYRRELSLRAAQESIVLLKNNNNVLPLTTEKNVAFLGEIASTVPGLLNNAKSMCKGFSGFADGYKLDADRSDDLTDEALALCKNAQAIVLFLGHGKKRSLAMAESRTLALPANQLALVERLSTLGKPIIAVIVGDFLADMRFDDKCAAVLFAPRKGVNAGYAILSVLDGAFNPCGKLAASAYNDTDSFYRSLRDYKNAGRNKIGVFVGYRYYTTDGTRVKYPFGHGLSYSKFEYAKFKRTATGVSVVVKNKSGVSGKEIVQLYISKRGSNIIRPARELKGFAKVELKRHKKKTVHIPLDVNDLAVYDTLGRKFKVESGGYTLYIGASSTDLKYSIDIEVSGDTLEKRGDKLSDYLRNVSNVVDGGYMLQSTGAKKNGQKTPPRILPDFPYEKLFVDEFGIDLQEDDDVDIEEIAAANDDGDDASKYIGVGVTPPQIFDALSGSLAAHGITAEKSFVRTVISAMASSRLLFVCTDAEGEYMDFISAFGEFLGCHPSYISAYGYSKPEDLFVDGDMPTPLSKLVGASLQNHATMQLVAFSDIRPEKLHEYFTPFIRYVSNPENNRITYGDYNDADKTMIAAPNIWFFMRVSTEEAATIPAHIADISSTIDLHISYGNAGREVKSVVDLNYYRFVNAFETAEKHELDERGWKIVDRLLNYVASRSGAKLSNKLWVRMEKFVGAYLSMTDDENSAKDALDAVIASELVPMFAPMLKGKLTKDDGDFSQTIRDMLGDEGSVLSSTMAARLAINASRS